MTNLLKPDDSKETVYLAAYHPKNHLPRTWLILVYVRLYVFTSIVDLKTKEKDTGECNVIVFVCFIYQIMIVILHTVLLAFRLTLNIYQHDHARI